ncbi:MAG: polysaccharide biosynthesis tyrosine autokinase [Acidobacteriota bacterium]
MDNYDRFDETEINLRDYWNVVWKRKWTIITFTLVLVATVMIMTFTANPTYIARGSLLIEKEPNIFTFEEIFQIETYRDDYYQTQYKLLQSRTLADKVVERLKLYENEEFIGKPGKRKKPVDKSDPVFRSSLIDSFLGRLDVKPMRQTRLIEINYKSHDPKLAANAVNALFDSFIEMNIETKYEATEQATEFLTSQIASQRAEIEQKQRELQEYGAKKNIIPLSEKETTIIEKLGELNSALTEAQIDRVRKEAYYNEIKIASSDYIPEALTNPLIQRLREDYVKLSREYMKKQETFKPDYPEMQRLKAELESAKKSLESETQNLIKGAYSDYQAALKKEKSLEEVFNKQKQEAIQLNSNAILYNSLKIEIENKKNLLESLLRRQSETGVSARLRGLRTSNIKIVDRAEIPLYPSSPKKRLNMMLALIIGLFIGIGLAFFFEYLDNSVKSSEDIERYAGLPSLGVVMTFSPDGFKKSYGYGYGHKKRRSKSKLEAQKSEEEKDEGGGIRIKIGGKESVEDSKDKSYPVSQLDSHSVGKQERMDSPLFKEVGMFERLHVETEKTVRSEELGGKGVKEIPEIRSIELITYFSPKSNFSESYRSIRTALLLSTTDKNLKSLVISSPLPQEGKTATICNLAITLAQTEKKVLIVDSDLRKPRQHKIFKIKNIDGLTNYLTMNVEMKDLIKHTEIPNLFLINSGPVPPNPAELLGSEKMANLIESLKQSFNYILFDTPPILAVSDAMVIGSHVDGVILIVWGGKTSRDALKQAKEKLDLLKLKTLGVIINNIKIREHEYYYKHYYYQYYGEQ